MKNRKIKIGLIAGVSGMVAIPSCNSQTGNLNNVNDQNADSVRLEERLKKLANTKYETELSIGAMCYDPVAPSFVDYICSYCGDTIKEKYDNWDVYNINAIEAIVEQIKSMEYDVALDKRAFCPHCSGKSIENPELIFKIRFSRDAEYHIVK
jgi:DNA-directed RNA polymerase subunit RPC12/RpoP